MTPVHTRGDARRVVATLKSATRPLVLPLLIGLPPLVWVLETIRRISLETLGRDQGIFQYVAWALAHGAKDYRDVRDVNGPLTHFVHLVFLRLGAANEHTFRVLDLTVTGASFALVGACLPGVGAAPNRDSGGSRAIARAGWAFAAWVILSAQYASYLYWDLAQRESFCDWFMLTSVALQLCAQSWLAGGRGTARRSGFLLVVAGLLSVIPWFGKPTYVLFTLAQVAALLLDVPSTMTGDSRMPRRWLLARFALGGALGALTQIAFLVAYADIPAFVRIYLVDVPAMYRFIWPRTAVETLTLPGLSTTCGLALVTSALMLALIADGQLPRRTLAVALLPLAAMASVLLQRKGFPYHFHPVSAGVHMQWLLIVVWLYERFGLASGRTGGAFRLLPFLAGALLTLRVALTIQASPHLQNLWILSKGLTQEQRESRDYLVYFRDRDFFPWELRQTAAYLRTHTKPSDRVQMYGMDPYLLFLAERLSATPYIYAYDLDVDAALFGSLLPEGLHPTWAESERIRRMRDDHERDFLERLQREPPAAFVFMDKAPLMTEDEDAWLDFASHCALSAAWVSEHYRQTASFGEDRVWLRRDLAD